MDGETPHHYVFIYAVCATTDNKVHSMIQL